MNAFQYILLGCTTCLSIGAYAENEPAELPLENQAVAASISDFSVHRRRFQFSVGFENSELANQNGFDVAYNRPEDRLIFSLSYDDIRPSDSRFYRRYILNHGTVDFDGLYLRTLTGSYALVKPFYLSNSQQLALIAGAGLSITHAKTFLDREWFPGAELHIGLLRKSRRSEFRISYHISNTLENTLDARSTSINTQTDAVRISFGRNF